MCANFDLANIESEPKKGIEEGALAIRLVAEGDNVRDQEFLSKSNSGGLEVIIGFESVLELEADLFDGSVDWWWCYLETEEEFLFFQMGFWLVCS